MAWDIYALTDDGRILNFDSESPDTIKDEFTIPVAASANSLYPTYTMVGMAYRITKQTVNPANPGINTLWGVAVNGASVRFYQINPTAHTVTQIGDRQFLTQTSVSNGAWYFGFDPATDRFRLIGTYYNYELNPNTMVITRQSDFPNDAAINGGAFSSAAFGGESKIYFLLQNNGMVDDGLFTSPNVAGGTVTPVGATGVNFTQPAGLSIFGGFAFMATWDSNASKQRLFSMNLSTGVATLVGDISATPASLYLYSIAIKPQGTVPPIAVKVTVSGAKKFTAKKSSIVIKGTAASDAGIKKVQYKVGSDAFKTAKGTTKWTASVKLKRGTNKIQVQSIGGNDLKSSIVTLTVTLK